MNRIQNLRARANNMAAKAAAASLILGATVMQSAHAAGFDDFIDAVDLTGLSAKVVAAGLLVVGIAIAFKGSDLGKRVVRKV